MNQLHALAMNEGYRWKKKLFREQAQLEKLALAPWASRRRQELLELLDCMNPTIEELTAAVEREARKLVLEQKLPTTPEAMEQTFGRMPRCRIASVDKKNSVRSLLTHSSA